MKTQFTFTDLSDSSAYYESFFDAIHNASKPYIASLNKPEKKADELYKGVVSYWYAFYLLTNYNRVILDLFLKAEMVVGMQLIRMELELLTAIYAETKWPFQILYKIYWKGKEFGKIKRNGNYINQTDLRKELDENFGTRISELYDQYTQYNHPSKLQINLGVLNDSAKKFFALNEGDSHTDNLIYINQTIGNVLLAHLDNINSKINNNE